MREPSPGILAEHVQFPDFPKGCAELLDAEGVNNWVDGRVAVSEDDGNVDQKLRLAVVRAKERDAVEDVKWEPADSKEEQNQGERLGQFQLLTKVAAGVCVAGGDLERIKDSIINVCQCKLYRMGKTTQKLYTYTYIKY